MYVFATKNDRLATLFHGLHGTDRFIIPYRKNTALSKLPYVPLMYFLPFITIRREKWLKNGDLN